MKKVMPQEIEVWYLIPAIRRELARIFIKEYGISQKESANILGVTEAAISQYLSYKRAKELSFSKEELKRIKNVAKKIIKNKDKAMDLIYELCVSFRKAGIICKLHRRHDKEVSKECKICMD
jgi:hypothetical protein